MSKPAPHQPNAVLLAVGETRKVFVYPTILQVLRHVRRFLPLSIQEFQHALFMMTHRQKVLFIHTNPHRSKKLFTFAATHFMF